jgi:sulfate transport system permease protein
LEQFNYQAATAIALVMLLTSFTMLFAINLLQRWNANRYAAG